MEGLIQKIIDVYFTYGIKSVTMDDLAKELGISKKTLYQQFSDKAMVINTCVDYLLEEYNAQLEKANEGTDGNAIDRIIETTAFVFAHQRSIHPSVKYDLQKYYPDAWSKIEDFGNKIFFNFSCNLIKQGVKEGLFEPNMDIDVVSRVFVNSIDFLACQQNSFFGNRDSSELLKGLLKYHIRGISTVKGIEYMGKVIDN